MAEAQDWNDGFFNAGNHSVLDLLNTSLVVNGEPVEMIPDTAALIRWLNVSGLEGASKVKTGLQGWSVTAEARSFLKSLWLFREDLRSAVLRLESGRLPALAFLADINERLSEHPLRLNLHVSKGKLESGQALGVSVADTLWGSILSETAWFLTEVRPYRVRQCEGCAVHFYDVSKKGSRRWCSMNLCGNRVKVAAYQQRKRETE